MPFSLFGSSSPETRETSQIRSTDEARFRHDLGGDWLDRLEVLITIEEQISGFEIADVVADQIETVGDLMRVIEGRDLTVALKSQPQAPALTAKISTRNPS